MSTFSKNPFALLSEDGEEAPAPTAAKAPGQAAAPAPAKAIPGQAKKPAVGGGASRGGYQRRDEATVGGEAARDDRGERRGRGGFRGRGGPRGRGRGAKMERPDRHSATGIQDTDKKVASGWGAEDGTTELKTEVEAEGDAQAEVSTPTSPVAPAANGANEGWGATDEAVTTEEAAPPVEEEDKTKTLGEYLAEQANAVKIGGPLEARPANEGIDDTQWQGGVELVRGGQEEEYFMGAQTKKASGAKKQPKEKHVIEVETLGYRPPRSDRGAPRGRGGARGGRDEGGRGRGEGRGRGRGGPRGPRGGAQRGTDLNPEDSNAFPSLS